MEQISARFKINTPMFMGGADNEKTAELRELSIRGALRFWWRALAWARHDALNDDRRKALEAMRDEEQSLFGSADEKYGQSAFLMRITDKERISFQQVGASNNFDLENSDGARYLGYGVIEHTGDLVRPCLRPGGEFTVEIRMKNKTTSDQAEQLKDALKALGLFGGLGSRSRRGWGSVTLLEMSNGQGTVFTRPGTSEDFQAVSRELLANSTGVGDPPPLSAFSGLTTMRISGANLTSDEERAKKITNQDIDKNALRLLNLAGERMLARRSYYQSPPQYEDDHDKFYAMAEGRDYDVSSHPKRVVFGLPHNYYSKKLRIKMDCVPATEGLDRRGSPLFFHIHELGDASFIIVLLILTSDFLPANEQISLNSTSKKSFAQNADFKVLTDFLDDKFPDAERIMP